MGLTTIVIRRSIKLWLLAPFAYAWALLEIHPFIYGIESGYFHQYGKGLNGPSVIGLLVAIGVTTMIVVDTYTRFIRKYYLEITPNGIVDTISKFKIGAIEWKDVEKLSIKRKWFGSTVYITFKRRTASPDLSGSLVIPQLEIAERVEAEILSLADNYRR